MPAGPIPKAEAKARSGYVQVYFQQSGRIGTITKYRKGERVWQRAVIYFNDGKLFYEQIVDATDPRGPLVSEILLDESGEQTREERGRLPMNLDPELLWSGQPHLIQLTDEDVPPTVDRNRPDPPSPCDGTIELHDDRVIWVPREH